MCFGWAEPVLFCCTGKNVLTGTGIEVLTWINRPGIRQRMFFKGIPAGENYTVWSLLASVPLCSPESSFVLSCVVHGWVTEWSPYLVSWAPVQVTVPRGGSGHQIMSGQKQDVQAVQLLNSALWFKDGSTIQPLNSSWSAALLYTCPLTFKLTKFQILHSNVFWSPHQSQSERRPNSWWPVHCSTVCTLQSLAVPGGVTPAQAAHSLQDYFGCLL